MHVSAAPLAQAPAVAKGYDVTELVPTVPPLPDGATPRTLVSRQFTLDSALSSMGLDSVAIATPSLDFDWFFLRHAEHHGAVGVKGSEDAGIPASLFSLVNSSVGASTLGMPLAMSLTGWGVGLAAQLIVAVGGFLTADMLIRVCVAEGCKSYDKAIERVLGLRWLHLFQLLMIVSTMGSLISYMILIGDFVLSFAPVGFPNAGRNAAVAALALFVILPLTLMRRVTSLWIVSLLSSAFVGVLALVLSYRCFLRPPAPTFAASHTSLSHLFQCLPILVLAYSNQTSVMPVFRELKEEKRTQSGFVAVTGTTYALVFLVYATVGVSGYYLFGNPGGNVLNSFTDKSDVAAQFVIACYFFKILFTYPMSNYPLRVTLHYLIHGETETTNIQHLAETVAPFAVALCVGLLVRDVGFIFSFVGAVSRTSVFYLYPCALYLRCGKLGTLSRGHVWVCVSLAAFGCMVMVLGVWSSILAVV